MEFTTCSVCKYNRCQIQLFPCRHLAHARCIYPWPIGNCPLCHVQVKDVKCLEIQEYSYLSESCSISNCSKVFGLQRDKQLVASEVDYLDAVSSSFKSGMFPFEEEISLPYVACSVLLCLPSRLSSRRLNAKLTYHSKTTTVQDVSEIVSYLKLQVRLSAAEERFLKHIAVTNGLEVCSNFLLVILK